MGLYFRKPSVNKTLPPRPPPAKTGPGRPPPPGQSAGRAQSAPQQPSPKPQAQKPQRKGLVLPPRPSPGHRLYNKYTVRRIPPHTPECPNYDSNTTSRASVWNCSLPSASTPSCDCSHWLQWKQYRRTIISGEKRIAPTWKWITPHDTVHNNALVQSLLRSWIYCFRWPLLQKSEVLLLLEKMNQNEFECQVGEIRGRVHKSRMQIITPLGSYLPPPQVH